MTGFGIGSANPAAPPPSLPLGSATWASGGWFDLISVAGNEGDAITAGSTSLAGSNVLTPQSSPLVNNTPVGGCRGCYVLDTGVSGTEPMFRCDAIAALFTAGAAITIGHDWRSAKQANMPLWQVRSGTGGVTDFIGAYVRSEKVVVEYRSASTGLVTLTGATGLAYDYHRITYRFTGTLLYVYIDGVIDPNLNGVSLAIPTLNVNRFAWLGSYSTTSFDGATGYARRLFVSPSDIGGSGITTVDDYLVAHDYTLQISNALVQNFICAGASILVGSTDTVTGAGYRAGISQYIIAQKLSWAALGDHPQGFVPTRETPAQSGQSATAITTQVISFVNSKTKLVVVDLGNQEINLGQTAGQVETAIATALQNIRTAVYAVAPDCAIATFNLCPYSESGFNAVVASVNAALPGIWDTSDANFPTSRKLMTADLNAAIGGPSYVQANFTAGGNDHPNNTGYNLLIPVVLAASNSSGDVLSDMLRQFSPT